MPPVTIKLPGLLTRFTHTNAVTIDAGTMDAAIEGILEQYPGLEPHLFDDRGDLRPHLQLYLNGERIHYPTPEPVPLSDGDTIVVLQAVSGG